MKKPRKEYELLVKYILKYLKSCKTDGFQSVLNALGEAHRKNQ